MNKYIYGKGLSLIEVIEINDMGMVQGLKGMIDITELMYILLKNGYRLIH
jgi:hypothetical protein